MGTPKPFALLGTDPALGSAQDDERTARRLCFGAVAATRARLLLNRMNLIHHLVEDRGHASMHCGRLRPCDCARFIAVAPKKTDDFVIGHPAEDGGVGDLVAIK